MNANAHVMRQGWGPSARVQTVRCVRRPWRQEAVILGGLALGALSVSPDALRAEPLSQSCLEPAGDVDSSGLTNVSDVQCFILTSLWSLSGLVGAGTEPACLSDGIYGPANGNLDYIIGADVNCDGSNDVSDVQISIFLALKQHLPIAIDLNQDDCVDVCLFDSDGDLVPNAGDCAPYDPRIGNGKLDVCDAIDNNCDSIIDVPIGPALLPAVPPEVCEDGLVCNGQATCPDRPFGMMPVITEVMVAPSGPTATAKARRWFEVFNPSSSDIDLRGWQVVGDTEAEQFVFAASRPLLLRAGGFAVMVADADFADNGGISGARGFRVIPIPATFTLEPTGDAISLVDPGGALADTVTWDASWAVDHLATPGVKGRSMRLSPALAQDAPEDVAALNDDLAHWAPSTAPWQPAQDYPGGISTLETDWGSPGGLWANGEVLASPVEAERCVAGLPSVCSAPPALSAYACVAAGCFEPGTEHPNAGTAGAAEVVEADAAHYDAASGCLVFVAEAFETPNPQIAAGACDDHLGCTDQTCILRVMEPSGGITDAAGCHYTPAAIPTESAGCFVVGQPGCVPTGQSNPANFCEWCQPVSGAHGAAGYSPKPASPAVYCDAAPGMLGSPIALGFDGATLVGDSAPCTVHVCQGDGTCGVDTAQGTAAWQDYVFDVAAGEVCPASSCAVDACDAGSGAPQCTYTHVGPGGGAGASECFAPAPECTGQGAALAACVYDAYDAPTCLPSGATPAGGATGCLACDAAQSLVGYSPRPAGMVCQGEGYVDRCTHFTCGGGAGVLAGGPAGECIDRGPWEALFCQGLPEAGCGAQQAANTSCVLGGQGTQEGVPLGTFYYLDDAHPTPLTQVDLDGIAGGAPFCGVEALVCGTACFIDGDHVPRGQLAPNNQCAWCNPDADVTGWSPREAGAPGYEATLTAAGLVMAPGEAASWTFGETFLADLCREDFAGAPEGAGVDGAPCTVQRCMAGAGGGEPACGSPVGWHLLRKDYLTLAAGNSDPEAHCLERVGNVVAGEDVSSCVDRACTEVGGAASCALVANGGDVATAPECFIGGRCHSSGWGNPFGVPGQPGSAYRTGQCAVCAVAAGEPATFVEWQAVAEGTPCNADDNGCTLDVCTVGVCLGSGAGPTVADAFGCTTDACADGTTDDAAYVTANDPANDYAGGVSLAGLVEFPPPVRVALMAAGQSFNDIHRVVAGACLIGSQCWANFQDALGAPGFSASGLAQNGVCATCSPGAVANTQVGMDAAPTPTNPQTAWTAPAGRPCTDGVVCTIVDTCTTAVGACRGTRLDAVCFDGNPCTIDRCDDDGSVSLPHPIAVGDDAYPEVGGVDTAFSGCEYAAAPTTQLCEDAIEGSTAPDLCTTMTTCAEPDGPTGGGPDGSYGNSRGQCQHGAQDPNPSNAVLCTDTNDCTYDFCRPDTGACTIAALPFYFEGEHAATGAKEGGGSGVPLKLGLQAGQVFDGSFAYTTPDGTALNPALVPTGVVRRCDLAHWCTSGTCGAAGQCIVVDQSDTAMNPAQRKCSLANAPGFDSDANACTEPRCDATAGTWQDDPALPGLQWTVFAPSPEPGLLAGDLQWLDSETGCYLTAVPDGAPCVEGELAVDAADEVGLGFDAMCASPSASVCQAGECVFQPVVCMDLGEAPDQMCRTYTCSAALGSTVDHPCVYAAAAGATCDDHNTCTNQACVMSAVPAWDPARVRCVSALQGGADIPPVGVAVPACAHIGECHPSVGWHPNVVQLQRIDDDLAWGTAGFDGGTALLGSAVRLTAEQRAGLEAAAGSAAYDDLDGDGVFEGPGDAVGCNDGDPCTAPDVCLVTGACQSAAVPSCHALNANTLCVLSGHAGEVVECPVRLAVASSALVPVATAYAIQMTVQYPAERVKMAGIEDELCFPISATDVTCVSIPAGASGFGLYPSGHTVAFDPPLALAPPGGGPYDPFADWHGQGTLLAADVAATGNPAPLMRSYFEPPFDPVTSAESHLTADPASPTAALEQPPHVLWTMMFALLEDIPADAPAIVYASELITVDQDARLVDNDVWNRIIVTKPFQPSAQCDGMANGTACSDGDPCTSSDACVEGVCVPGGYLEGQTCDGSNGACVACAAGVCGPLEVTPAMCMSSGPNPALALACALSGEAGTEQECWLLLARVSAEGPHASAHEVRLAWEPDELELLALYDKTGKEIVQSNPLIGVEFSSMASAEVTYGDLSGNGDPTPVPNASVRHMAFVEPADPALAVGWMTLALQPLPLGTASTHLTEATVVAGVPADAATLVDLDVPEGTGEPMPGAYARLRFRLLSSATVATPHVVSYAGEAGQPSAAPRSAADALLEFTVSNTVVKTGPPAGLGP